MVGASLGESFDGHMQRRVARNGAALTSDRPRRCALCRPACVRVARVGDNAVLHSRNTLKPGSVLTASSLARIVRRTPLSGTKLGVQDLCHLRDASFASSYARVLRRQSCDFRDRVL